MMGKDTKNKNKDALVKSCEVHHYIGQSEDISIEKLTRKWHKAFNSICKSFGFTKPQRKVLWRELAAGNWIRFHLTDEESRLPASFWLDKFSWDVFYCSDRWSIDRLTRCHWLFRQCVRAAEVLE